MMEKQPQMRCSVQAAFVSLGLSNANKVVVNIMNSLEGEHPQGLAFSDFIHLSIGVAESSHSRKHIDKIFSSFDSTQRVKGLLFRVKLIWSNLDKLLLSLRRNSVTSRWRTSSTRQITTRMASSLLTTSTMCSPTGGIDKDMILLV
jgi:hypothetical protein